LVVSREHRNRGISLAQSRYLAVTGEVITDWEGVIRRLCRSLVPARNWNLDCQGSIPSRDKRYLFSPQCPHQFWGPPNLLSSWYGGSTSGGKVAGARCRPLTSIYCWGWERSIYISNSTSSFCIA
jgi:hypothetical protein